MEEAGGAPRRVEWRRRPPCTFEEISSSLSQSSLGFPVVVKASAGGGGKGMRIVRSDASAVAEAFSLAAAVRGAGVRSATPRVYAERLTSSRPRHIEVQILGDRARQRGRAWGSASARSSAATRR